LSQFSTPTLFSVRSIKGIRTSFEQQHHGLRKQVRSSFDRVSPSMFVPRLASELKCPDEIRQRARALAEQAEERGVTTGVHPAGFAAACLYKVGREEGRWLTQSEAADVANASKATVRAHRDTLEEQVA
jgi:transcription initiation factor TFIIB